jgi:hypothetical protein
LDGKLASQCVLKDGRLNDARHGHTSLILKQGIHPKIVQERQRLNPEHKKAAVEKFG